MNLFWVSWWALLALRAMELGLARLSSARLRRRGARFVADDGMGLIVLVHVLLFTGSAAESGAPWRAPTDSLLALSGWGLFGVGMALRYWSMAALGDRWNTRVYVLPGLPLVTHGPYRWIRHPIYLGVFLELGGLGLAWGSWATLLATAPLHVVALRRRIRKEEAALGIARSI